MRGDNKSDKKFDFIQSLAIRTAIQHSDLKTISYALKRRIPFEKDSEYRFAVWDAGTVRLCKKSVKK